ncbi:MAG: TatD family hydrolase [Prevotella sp.]|nr:TatD family hydrolase [Prevotella sp.]
MNYIDTHTHIDGEEFKDDLDLVIQRAKDAGALKLFVPGINVGSIETIKAVCTEYLDFCYPMLGLHPEDVKEDWQEQLATLQPSTFNLQPSPIAIGEIGLDFYWSREFEKEQLLAFEQQVEWAIEAGLPLMIHCRKAQNEMVKILRKYEGRLHGGVFHCFTGNEHEAEELLAFDGFCLGIGGVLTFKKSNLPQTLANAVPLERIVLETDAPYMAPVPHRGERNESSLIPYIIYRLAEVYGKTPDEIADITTENVKRTFPLAFSK